MTADIDSITAFLKKLIAIPSRAGIDPYGSILRLVERWGEVRQIPFQSLKDESGEPVALLCSLQGLHADQENEKTSPSTYLLNATLDTATFGDVSTWTSPPAQPTLRDGWLYGRGSADSKAAVAIFCNLVSEFVALRDRMRGGLHLLLDTDEHTGDFAGVKRYFKQVRSDSLSGAFLGYPGNNRIVVGSRGFSRSVITVHGRGAHSGGSQDRGINAVQRAALLIERLSLASLPEETSTDFPLPPRITVTAVHGGEGFSSIPDACSVNVDCRLTPLFGEPAAQALIQKIVMEFDSTSSSPAPTSVGWSEGWPAYRTSSDHVMVRTIQEEAERYFAHPIPIAVVGPSNIGNLLAPLGIPCVGGFGVNYRAIHASDECIELASIEPVYRTYCATFRRLLEVDRH